MNVDPGPAGTGETVPPSGERGHSGEWECMECGYIEAGAKIERPEVCPECGAPTQALEFFPYEGDEVWDDVAPDDEDLFEDADDDLR